MLRESESKSERPEGKVSVMRQERKLERHAGPVSAGRGLSFSKGQRGATEGLQVGCRVANP